jgi:cold shock CspA family protein
MRFEGILSAWNQDAGYGTIRALHGGDELLVGLAAFPTDGEGPRLDETLSFEIVSGRDGRKQAVNLKRLPRARPALREAAGVGQARVRQAQRKRRLTLLGGAVVAVVLVVGGVHWWQPQTAEPPKILR